MSVLQNPSVGLSAASPPADPTKQPGLFRLESVQRQHARLEGELIVPISRSLSIAGFTTVVSVLVLGFIVSRGTYAPRETVEGFLHPVGGFVKVVGPRAGKVLSVDVREGDIVAVGQQLAQISLEQELVGEGAQTRLLEELDQEKARLVLALRQEQRLTDSRQARLRGNLQKLKKELESIHSERGALEAQKLSAESVLKRMLHLSERGYITESEVAQRKEQILGLEREWHALVGQTVDVEHSITDTELQIEELSLERDRRFSELRNHISRSMRERTSTEAAQSYVITAPIDGVVTALQIEVGRPITPAQPLLAIVASDAELAAQLFVPSRSIGFIETGQRVRLRYAAYPYQQYGVFEAEVTDVSRTAYQNEEWAIPLQTSEPTYRITAKLVRQAIDIKGKVTRLQPGMTLSADILLEDRPIWAWLFEPILAFRGAL